MSKKAPYVFQSHRRYSGKDAVKKAERDAMYIRLVQEYLKDKKRAYGFVTWLEVCRELENEYQNMDGEEILKHLTWGWGPEDEIDFHLVQKRLGIEWSLQPYILYDPDEDRNESIYQDYKDRMEKGV